METTKKTTQDITGLQDDWQLAENHENQPDIKNNEADGIDLRSAEASGYGTDIDDADETDDTIYASDRDDEEEDDDNDDDDSNDDDDDEPADWGNVDPQANPGPFPDSNDPTAPGSAV